MNEPKHFFPIDVSTIHQSDGSGNVLVGKLSFDQLNFIHKFTERKENLSDPFNKNETKKASSLEEKEFQRMFNEPKLKKMIKFLEENYKKGKFSLGLFPTSMIIALELSEYTGETISLQKMDDIYEKNKKEKILTGCFIGDNLKTLFVPKDKRIALIVDGQHRLKSVQRFFKLLDDENFKNNFEFPVTFLVGFDDYEVSQIFAKVNFEQKKVNRSIYYDIFGSIPELSDIKLSHDLALHLNNNDYSPANGMIKLLGKGPGLFSQAFFVKKIKVHFKKVWKEIYEDYLEGGEIYKEELPKFMRAYLNSIKNSYNNCWPEKIQNPEGELVYDLYNRDNPYEYILCKPTGMGAFFRLINEFYPIVKNLSEREMEEKITKILQKLSLEEVENLFSINGRYGKTSSEGFVSKLYKELKKLYGFR